MKNHLVDKHQKALALMREKCFEDAIPYLNEIVAEQPDWEHGEGFYSLATCYAEMHQLENALHCYQEALSLEPQNPYYLGGYASFLYLHGDPKEALNTYFEYIQSVGCSQQEIEECMPALKILAARIGLSEESIQARLAELEPTN